jgi:hypothetical protein
LLAEILRVHPDEPEQERIDYIVSCLRSGKVVGVPTDTFYGLAVDPVNLMAVERIYEIKTRLKHKPLSLLIANAAQAYGLAGGTFLARAAYPDCSCWFTFASPFDGEHRQRGAARARRGDSPGHRGDVGTAHHRHVRQPAGTARVQLRHLCARSDW